MLIWGQAPLFNIFRIRSIAEVVTDVEMRGLSPNQQKKFRGHAQKCLTRPYDGSIVTNAARAEKARASLLVRESGQLH